MRGLLVRDISRPEGALRLWNGLLWRDKKVPWHGLWALVFLKHWMDKNGIEA